MWTVPRREGPDERCDRLIALYEQQIADLAASRPTPYWDGHCGLVQVRDEDYVRPDSAQNTAAAAAPAEQEAAEHTRQRQQRARQHPAAPGQDTRRAAEGLAAGLCTPPAASPRSSPGSSPFKPGPGALPRGKQSASVLADRAVQQLQQGRLRDAEALLHSALRACPTTDTQLAGRCIDLLLEAEREAQTTPSHSRAPSDVDPQEDNAAAGGGTGGAAVGEVAPLLRGAVEALAAGEERRAGTLLQRAADACPPELHELRRRVELYLELVQSKRRP